MIVALSPLFSEDIVEISDVIVRMSDDVEYHMHNKNYGEGVDIFAIGVICVAPEFQSFIKVRKTRYFGSRKALEYDLKLNYSYIKEASKSAIIKLTIEEIVRTIPKVKKANVPDFDNNMFVNNFIEYLKLYQAS